MTIRRWHVVAVAMIAFGLSIPTFATADENPIDRDEYGHLSGQLAQLLGIGGGVGGGSLSNRTCTTSGDPAANIDLS
jgi:hypothetical protein